MSRKARREMREDLQILEDILSELKKIGVTLSKREKIGLAETLTQEVNDHGADGNWLAQVLQSAGPLLAEIIPLLAAI
jgi:hypothetical protein